MIGIIGAMDLEIESLIKQLDNPLRETVSGVVYTRGRLCGKEVVLAVCGVGKVFAALCAEAMILRYAPSAVINIGVAGTLSGKIGIGDIAVGTSAVCHDMDTSPIGDPLGFISGIRLVNIPLDKKLADAFFSVCEKRGIGALKGTIASGDQFICDKEKKKWIGNTFSAIACEMEGQAISQVCYVNHTPCAILRSISDNADGVAADFDKFKYEAAEHAVRVLTDFLSEN